MKKRTFEGQASIKQELQEGAFKGTAYSKEDIRKFLVRDIKGVYIVLAEILQSDDAVNALVEVYYRRYQEMMAQQPLDFDNVPSSEQVEANG